jgi:hypothetical protein
MLLATARRRVAAWRHPRTSARLARALWIAWAVIVWNVVFDHAIVVAGRDYIAAARRAAAAPAGPLATMDDWMRPAVTRGFWMATAAGAAVLVAGVVAVSVSARAAGVRQPRNMAGTAADEGLALGGETR